VYLIALCAFNEISLTHKKIIIIIKKKLEVCVFL